ncbi:hypothetical protein SAMN05216312_10610 [Cohnella sp. OV330]|uniref:hypothetical protein n=1 Tax=Cohnella sp. OV330 TaxID=1855288 RepID=UPI0008E311FB|nr:hypothetical protein [Cohnella sp. OV330]SFB33046.1 hypothetical protein SAMN05216312_10610 [Cohnella sp. OV330]
MQTHPLQFVIFGFLIVIFGVADLLFLNPYVGAVLVVAGIALAVFGWRRVRASKKKRPPQA